MPTTLKTVVTAQIDAVYKNLLDISTPTDSFQKKSKIELTNGTGANSADLMFHDQRTLAASGTENLDLAGSLVNPLTGEVMTFVEVRAVLVTAASGNTNSVQVTRPSTNGAPLFIGGSDGINVRPGGLFMWAAPADGGLTVTAGTGDLLTVTNTGAGTPVTYDIVIIGTSA